MKGFLLVSTALFIVACSTTQEPADEPWASMEFIVTSRLEYGKAEPNVEALANAYFWGDGEFVSPDIVKVNNQTLAELSEGNFSIGSPQIPDTPYSVHWYVRRYLGTEIDREFQLPSVLHFVNVNNGDTISASQGKVIAHTGSNTSKLKVWIESTFPHVDTTSVGFLQDNDGQLELMPSDLSRLKTNKTYRLFISSELFVNEQLQSAAMTFSLYSEAIMEFVLVE